MMLHKTTTLTGFIGLALLAQSATAENLMAIYELAVNNDPTFEQAEANNQSAQERTSETRAGLLPSIDLNANKSRTEYNGSTNDSSGYSLTLSQSIYNRNVWITHRSAKHAASRSDAELASAREGLIMRVAQAYFDVLRAMDNLTFAKAEKQANARQLDQAKQRFDVGLVAITDVHESQASFDRSAASLIAAENDVDSKREALREITGTYPEQLNLLDKKAPLVQPEPDDIEHWTKLALDNNADLQAAQLYVKQTEDNLAARRAAYQPKLGLTASYSDNSGTLSATLPNDKSVSLNLSMNLFASGATNASVNQGIQDLRAAKAYLDQQTRRTQRDARSAYLNVHAGISRVKALGQAVVSSESALRASEAGFEVGTRTTVDVLQSRRQLYSSQADYAGARYDYIIQMLSLKLAAGDLNVEDLRKINNWLTQ